MFSEADVSVSQTFNSCPCYILLHKEAEPPTTVVAVAIQPAVEGSTSQRFLYVVTVKSPDKTHPRYINQLKLKCMYVNQSLESYPLNHIIIHPSSYLPIYPSE